MKTTTPRRWRRASQKTVVGIMALSALLFFGCSILPEPVTDPTRYYLLSSTVNTENPSVAPKGTLHIGIRAVELPLYLRNNRTIVVRSGGNEIRYQDYARWAEPLDLAVQRVVRDQLLASDVVAGAEIAPFSADLRRDFDVVIRVLQCEGGVTAQGKKTAQFSAIYEIINQREGAHVVLRKNFNSPPVEWDGINFAALAARLSDATAALGNDIATNIPR